MSIIYEMFQFGDLMYLEQFCEEVIDCGMIKILDYANKTMFVHVKYTMTKMQSTIRQQSDELNIPIDPFLNGVAKQFGVLKIKDWLKMKDIVYSTRDTFNIVSL